MQPLIITPPGPGRLLPRDPTTVQLLRQASQRGVTLHSRECTSQQLQQAPLLRATALHAKSTQPSCHAERHSQRHPQRVNLPKPSSKSSRFPVPPDANVGGVAGLCCCTGAAPGTSSKREKGSALLLGAGAACRCVCPDCPARFAVLLGLDRDAGVPPPDAVMLPAAVKAQEVSSSARAWATCKARRSTGA